MQLRLWLCELLPWLVTSWAPAAYNFDHPDAFDKAAILQCLLDLKVRRWGGLSLSNGTAWLHV